MIPFNQIRGNLIHIYVLLDQNSLRSQNKQHDEPVFPKLFICLKSDIRYAYRLGKKIIGRTNIWENVAVKYKS